MANEEENLTNDITSSTPKLCRDISSLYFNQKFTDVCLIVNDEKIYVHKAILAVRSHYFEDLFYGDLNESKQDEITIKDVSLNIFEILLIYIYTDDICVTSSNIDSVVEVFALAGKFCMKDLQDTITSKLKQQIDLQNVCSILNMANLYLITELRNACYSFLEENPNEFLNTGVHNLTQESLVGIMQRDTFSASELDIFRAIAKWLKENEDPNNLVAKCVRLGWLSIDEIYKEVLPTNIYTQTELVNANLEIRGIAPKTTNNRAAMVLDKNLADFSRGAELLVGSKSYNENRKQYLIYHEIHENNNITIKLRTTAIINHIRMTLDTTKTEHSKYYVETSLDETNWEDAVDHTQYPCRSAQNLFFGSRATRYIRIVGTKDTRCDCFRLTCFEAYYKTSIPPMINNLVRPNTNVATAEHGAVVIKGKYKKYLLNGDIVNYNAYTGYTSHPMKKKPKDDDPKNITIQLGQPFLISTMRFLLWDLDDRQYSYVIEASVDERKWEHVTSCFRCRSWQNIQFRERPVVFVRITGTSSTAEKVFKCVHFECPSSDHKEKVNSAEVRV